MSLETILCPACGEADALRGARSDDGTILIRCETCEHRWVRDPDVCPLCGGRTISDEREPLIQKARGTQQSIIGYRIVPVCWSCGYREDPGAPARSRS